MTAPALPGLFGALEPVLNHYGYLAVAGLVLVEDFGIPVPGETILIAASRSSVSYGSSATRSRRI